MRDAGLSAQKLSEALEVLEIFGFANATCICCGYRILDRIEAEMFLHLVRIGPELDTLVKVFDPLVVELDARNQRYQRQGACADDQEQFAMIANHRVGETLHGALRPLRRRRYPGLEGQRTD